MAGEERVFHYLCIDCPLGCRLEVEEDEAKAIVEIRGFTCKKGKVYGAQEHTDPRRMVTTTVAAEGGVVARLPVRTSASVPRDRVGEVCRALSGVTVAAPVAIGQVIVTDVANTGADIVATRDLPAA